MKNKLSNKLLSLISYLLVSSFYLITPLPVNAQSAGLSVAPPVVQILLAPNKKYTQAFTITNSGESGEFVASFHSAMPNGIDGHASINPDPLDLSKISITPTLDNADITLGEPFELTKGKTQQLVVSLEGSSIKDTEDTYLALVIKSHIEAGETTITSAGVSALIFVTLSGDNTIPVKLEVSNFDFPAYINSGKVLKIEPILENQSSSMIRPEGNLQITNFQGKNIYQVDLYNNLILSRSKRLVQGINNDKQPTNLAWTPPYYAFGPHTLRLTIETAGKSKILEVDRVVWFIPISILIIFLLAITIVIMIILLKRRLYKHIPDQNS